MQRSKIPLVCDVESLQGGKPVNVAELAHTMANGVGKFDDPKHRRVAHEVYKWLWVCVRPLVRGIWSQKVFSTATTGLRSRLIL